MEQEKIKVTDFKKEEKKRFHPIVVFIFLIFGIILISGVFGLLDISATFNQINPLTLEIESNVVGVRSLFSFTGLRYILSNAVKNFISFAPLGMILVSLLGVSVAEKSGYLQAAFTKLTNKLSYNSITFIIVFLGIVSSLASEVGYVILLPIAALLFLIQERNPLTGMAAAFGGISVGYGINMLLGPIDSTLAAYSTSAAKVIDETYEVAMNGNLFFIIVATIIFTFLGTYITENIVVKKTGIYKGKNNFKKIELTKREKKGLALASYVVILLSILFIYMIMPGLPGSGVLLDSTETIYINQLFGYNSAFAEGLTFIIALILLLGGISYGIASRKIKGDKDMAELVTSSLDGAGHYLGLIFFAAQFLALFKYTNIGTIAVAKTTEMIGNFPFQGIPMMILFFIMVGLLNLIATGTIGKWAIIAPVFIPVLMQYNISPEFTQLLYRISDSATNGITPFLAYFVIFLALSHKYTQDEEKNNIRSAIYLILPYSIGFGIVMLALALAWYFLGLPIGPGAFPIL